MQKIIWLLFHEPAELFIRTARHFEEEINKLTGNQFEFEILELREYEERYCSGLPCDPVEEIKQGRVQMSQLYSQVFPAYNATDFAALGLPFLFRDHDHATRVFEGPVGKNLMNHLQEKVQVKGLGFTYSGGYRCWKSDVPIQSLQELKSLTVSPRQHPVGAHVWKLLGVTEAQPGELSNICNTTLPRFHADGEPHQHHVIETGHSMYLTTIFMNEDLWNSFDQTTQDHFMTASQICSRVERAQSIEDGERIKTSEELKRERGIDTISRLPDSEQQQLVETLQSVKHLWKQYLSPGLIDDIVAA